MIVRDFPKTTGAFSRAWTWAVVVAVYGTALPLPLAAQTIAAPIAVPPPVADPSDPFGDDEPELIEEAE